MDITELLKSLSGNNLLLILLGLFLFKDQLLALIGMGPKPAPLPPPPETTPPAPHDTPIIDAIIKLLPVILPIFLAQAKEAVKKEEEAAK